MRDSLAVQLDAVKNDLTAEQRKERERISRVEANTNRLADDLTKAKESMALTNPNVLAQQQQQQQQQALQNMAHQLRNEWQAYLSRRTTQLQAEQQQLWMETTTAARSNSGTAGMADCSTSGNGGGLHSPYLTSPTSSSSSSLASQQLHHQSR